MAKTVRYHDILMDELQDKELCIAYLNECLSDEDPRIFLNALRNVIEAQFGSMQDVAKKSNIQRQHLYKMLSDDGNPQLSSIYKLINGLGFKLSINTEEKLNK
jgi:probable addiction module antidote protein